jgi:hypothetical protein
VRLRVVRFTPSRSDTIGYAGEARKVSFAHNFLRFGAVLRWIKAGDRPPLNDFVSTKVKLSTWSKNADL